MLNGVSTLTITDEELHVEPSESHGADANQVLALKPMLKGL